MERGELEGVITAVVDEARSYLGGIDAEPVLEAAGAVSGLGGALPDEDPARRQRSRSWSRAHRRRRARPARVSSTS